MPALISAVALSPSVALAEGDLLRLQADLEFIYSLIDTEADATGEETDTEFTYFKRQYDIEIQKELYPYLTVRGGGLFELIDSETDTDGTQTGFNQTTSRLFGEINLDNPLYTLGGAYRRREFEFNPDNFATTRIFRDEYAGLLQWRPVGFPTVDLDFNHFHTWDDADTRDQTVDLLVLKTRYDYEDFASDYTYTRNDQDESITDFGSLTQIHNGGLRYTRDFLQDRLEVTGAARFNYEALEPLAEGLVELPTTSPGSAFFLLDDSDPTTLTDVDAANPLTTVNIGAGAPLIPVGIGLDFGAPTEVDRIRVAPLVDQQDPTLASPGEIAALANTFMWSVFTSDDQVNWVEQMISSVIYDVFENRWEITLASTADTPYIKVVTTPLPAATGEIRIREIRALTTEDVEPGETLENFTQTYNLGIRWQVTDRTRTFYESFLRIREDKPFDRKKTTLTNGFTVQHDFNPIFYGDARVLRTDTFDTFRTDSVRHTYSASLIADWYPTLNQRLVYSGEHDEEGGSTGYSNSIILRTNADVYRGWGANLDLGYTTKNPIFGPDSTSTILRLSTNIAPNERLNFTVDYLGSWDTESDRGSSLNHLARFQMFWVPLRTLSLYGSVALRDEERDLEGLKVSQDYSINWAPFPDGALNFNLAYNQNIDTQDRESRILTPELNWQVTRTTLLTVSFDYGTIETDVEKRDLKVLRANFRTYY